MTLQHWTLAEVSNRLLEAADVLRRLPANHPGRHITSSWPDIVRSFKDFRHIADPGRPIVRPDPKAIDRMDEVLMEWFSWLDGAEVKILWGWMARLPAARVAGTLGISRSTLHRRRTEAVKKLGNLLNSRRRPVILADTETAGIQQKSG